MKMLSILLGAAILVAPYAYSQDPDLPIKCDHGVLAEIYAAKAAKFKGNGSYTAYQKARESALEHGAELGYPDGGVDMMINAGIDDAKVKGSVTDNLASLSTNGVVISPLIQDCLKKPENYIRNYQN